MPIKTMKCPKCGKRACDVSRFLLEDFSISMKCPHCKNIVEIKASKIYELKRNK